MGYIIIFHFKEEEEEELTQSNKKYTYIIKKEFHNFF